MWPISSSATFTAARSFGFLKKLPSIKDPRRPMGVGFNLLWRCFDPFCKDGAIAPPSFSVIAATSAGVPSMVINAPSFVVMCAFAIFGYSVSTTLEYLNNDGCQGCAAALGGKILRANNAAEGISILGEFLNI